MKHHLNGITVAIASLFLTTLNLKPAQAYTFGQQEVDQSKFIAIAVPFAEGKLHNLIILEQMSDSQSCWQEKADQPGVIDPLLLKFDFSGICGRSTDSNGYSIRQSGQDLALNYRLSIVKRQGHLELMGYPSKNPSAPQLKLGQTTSTADGFLKIELLPGWRFTKRTYNGKTLGHIYITRDQVPNIGSETLAEAPADAVPPISQDRSKPEADGLQPLNHKPAPKPTKIEHPVPIPLRKETKPTPSQTSKVSNPQAREALTRLITSPIEIPVPAPNSSSNLKPEPAIPYTRKPSNETTISPSERLPSDRLQNPAPSQHPEATPLTETDSDLPVLEGENPDLVPKSKQYQHQSRQSTPRKRKKIIKLASKPPLSRRLFSRPVQIPVPPIQKLPKISPGVKKRPVNAPGRSLPVGLLPVPQEEVPLGRFNLDSDIYAAHQDASRASQLAAVSRTGNPPPPPLDARSRLRYRVVVKVANASQHQKIKTLVPDAFRSSYKGRSVLQVGAYESQAEANERLDKLSFEGIHGILEVR